MRRLVLAVAAVLAVTLSSAAADKVVPLFADEAVIVPEGSPLTFQALGEHDTAYFSGKVLLTGTYYYGDGYFNDGPDIELEMYFYPDAESWVKLPRLKTRGQPKMIFLQNAAPFVKAVIAPKTLARLKKDKKAGYASGKAAIWVDHFVAGIECDGPSFGAHFVSLDQRPLAVTMREVPSTSC